MLAAMTSLAAAQLTQRKLVTGTPPALAFHVQETVLASGGFDAPFKILASGVGELMTVAEYADVAPLTALPVNPLNRFGRGSTFAGTAQVGDTLWVTPPEEWGELSTPWIATVSAVDTELVLSRRFWMRATGLAWTLLRNAATIASGTTGESLRNDTGLLTFRDVQFQSTYATAGEALTHIAYTQTALKSLGAALTLAGENYLAESPGNPVVTSYTA